MTPATSSAAVNPNRFSCSICGDPSADICVQCTKDACPNHRCERCRRCSDCCHCEVPLAPNGHEGVEREVEMQPAETVAEAAPAAEAPVLDPEPMPPQEQ